MTYMTSLTMDLKQFPYDLYDQLILELKRFSNMTFFDFVAGNDCVKKSL